MQRSQRTTARFTRLCQVGAVLLFVPILMAIGCPLTVTVTCPADGAAGTAATVTVTVSGGQGAATWTTDALNGTVADGAMASPSVTPAAGGTVTVTVTATDEAGDTATGSCEFEADPAPCTDDAGCDDDLFCNGAETCDLTDPDNGVCVAGTDQCTGENETCDEANDGCITSCTDDAGCDDGDPCNGAETCDLTDPDAGVCAAGTAQDCDDGDACTVDTCDASDAGADATTGCVNTAMTCDAGEECSGGVCVKTCTAAADCDDSDPCTDEACVAGLCENTAKDCDDGLFCTGTETCNADTGDCESSGDPCDAATETCNETDGDCDPFVSCTDNAGCDDGVFCNGDETCDLTDPDNGVCIDGAAPCAADEDCDENLDACIAPPGDAFVLTSGTDSGNAFKGGSGDDTYISDLVNEGGVANVQTLNNNDQLDGGGGTDTLTATIKADVTPSSLAGIEIFNVSNIDDGNAGTAGDLALTSAADVTTVKTSGNADPQGISFTSIPNAVANYEVANNALAVSFTVVATALTDATDEATLTLSSVTGGVVTIAPSAAGSGYETLNVISTGSIANAPAQVTQGAGTSLTTVNVSGAQALNFTAALDGTVTTFDGSTATGKLTADLSGATAATTVKGGSADDTFDCSAAQNYTVTGNDGDDRVDFGTNMDASDSLDCGDGTDDTLAIGNTDLNAAGALANGVAGATNCEWLEMTTGATSILDADRAGGIGQFVYSTAGNDVQVTNFANADLLKLKVSKGTVDPDVKVNNLSNVANVEINGTAAVTVTTLDVVDHETLNLVSEGSDGNTVSTLTAKAGATVNITGAKNLTISATTNSTVYNAGTYTGKLTLTGSESIDDITGSPQDDVISGLDGGDTIATGTGADDVIISDDDATHVVSDFTVGTSGDQIIFDESDLTGDLVGSFIDGAGNAVATARNPATWVTGLDGAAITMTATTTMVKYTDTTGNNANTDLAVTITLDAAHAASDRIAILWYDADDAQAVVTLVGDTAADTDISTGDAGFASQDIVTMPMSAADFTNLVAANFAVQT